MLFLFITIFIINTNIAFKFNIFNKNSFSLSSKNFNDLFEDSFDQCSDKKLEIQWKFSKNSLNENVNTFSEINNINWLFEKNGILIRNGPAIFGQYTHVFDGIAKLTSYKFYQNKILFSSQFIRSKWFKNIRKNVILPSITVGPYNWTLLENIQILLNNGDFDNNPVNIHQIANTGPIVATTDSLVQIEFNPDTLKTIGKINYKNSIINNGIEMLSTAHPKVFHNYTINYFLEVNIFGKNIAHIVKIDSELNRTIIGSVEVEGVPYVHDFSVTENYVILCIWPLRINLGKILNGKGLLSQTDWFEKENSKIYIFDIHKINSKYLYYHEASPFFAYHHINAYEENNNIVLDVALYKNGKVVNGANSFGNLENLRNKDKRQLYENSAIWTRFYIPLSTKEIDTLHSLEAPKIRKIVPLKLRAVKDNISYGADLITINKNFIGKKHRYSYGVTPFADKKSFEEWALLKLDHHETFVTKNTIKKWHNKNCYPSEPIFVPKSDDGSEDDGVILSQVYDGNVQDTFLLILNATTMMEIGRAYVNMKCPISFHGKWFEFAECDSNCDI